MIRTIVMLKGGSDAAFSTACIMPLSSAAKCTQLAAMVMSFKLVIVLGFLVAVGDIVFKA